MRGVIVGAYAASPAWRTWDAELEERFLAGLAALPEVAGLELPWVGALHPHDERWLLAHLPRRFAIVLTDVPHVMRRIEDPSYGLASAHEGGRRAAVEDADRLRVDASRLADVMGRAPLGIMLHAAPHPERASVDALARSLEEIAGWDWDGARLVIEHCDAAVPGRASEKGWSPLGDELAAIRRADAGVAIALNWGRSAIETRDPDRVVDHVREAADAGLLAALVLSGASAVLNAFGPAWQDNHPPAARDPLFRRGEPTSLLTARRMRIALASAPDLEWLGMKYGVASPTAPVADRVALIADGVGHLRALGGLGIDHAPRVP